MDVYGRNGRVSGNGTAGMLRDLRIISDLIRADATYHMDKFTVSRWK